MDELTREECDRTARLMLNGLRVGLGEKATVETALQAGGLLVTRLFKMIPIEHRRSALDDWIDVLRSHFPHG